MDVLPDVNLKLKDVKFGAIDVLKDVELTTEDVKTPGGILD